MRSLRRTRSPRDCPSSAPPLPVPPPVAPAPRQEGSARATRSGSAGHRAKPQAEICGVLHEAAGGGGAAPVVGGAGAGRGPMDAMMVSTVYQASDASCDLLLGTSTG
ncbi:unnamed protein product [Miscanthus lutarioriparius]|uniref:Uncharacterized protein n=1 Tax=Miscanthus lutarioriparius TaxID=422564 RepID=A0A811PB36_9POAL|nr:unnamed protein product [Miscanthus lutarioriparius]